MAANRAVFRRTEMRGPVPGWASRADAVSERARAAIRALVVLARSDRQLSAAEIAERAGMARGTAGAILGELHECGLVYKTGAGACGLAFPPAAIAIAQIIRAVDGPATFLSCDSMLAPDRCADCKGGELCAVQQIARRLNAGVSAVLDNYSLAEAIAEDAG